VTESEDNDRSRIVSLMGIAIRGFVQRLITIWRSPSDQPPWARPALLLLAVGSGVASGWGLNNDVLEPFYGAAARSMSSNWHDFFFGAFDPAGTVTVDKLPGELWVQALLLRVTGFHVWTVVLPQVVEGSIAVLVLYRVVRRLAGPVGGIVAAACLAASPINVLLNRGNISDSLFILLLVLAADAATESFLSRRARPLILSGVWIGLAFQAKMLEAWVLIPVTAIAYLVAAQGKKARWRDVALFALSVVVVSLSWMTVVSIVPAHDRPYVDASRNDSEFEQVFYYNGLDRFGITKNVVTSIGPEAPFLKHETKLLNVGTDHVAPAWNRLLRGPFGDDDGWLLPVALLSLIGLGLRRKKYRADASEVAGVVFWGLWLALFFVIFSSGRYLNSYYVAALSPAIAALCGLGTSAIQKSLSYTRGAYLWLVAAVSSSAAYAIFLLPNGAGIRTWLVPSILAGAVIADIALLVLRSRRFTTSHGRGAAILLGFASVLLAPSVTSGAVVVAGLGPFDYPYDSPSVRADTQVAPRISYTHLELDTPRFLALFPHPNSVVATETSGLGASLILVTGKEFLPIGGYLGGDPVPTLPEIESLVSTGRLVRVIASANPPNPDPRFVWIRDHCGGPFQGVQAPPLALNSPPVITNYICGGDLGSPGPVGGAGTSATSSPEPVATPAAVTPSANGPSRQ
jgi:4-amino-4-deoxy-L-arabinose transferase-like glycosyltransferase